MSTDQPRRLMIVPTSPGEPLRPVAPAKEPDEVDGLVDELLGEDTTDGPGLADIVLFAGGVVAVVWGTWISSTALVVTGIVVGLLGVVLPLRSLGRRVRARRTSGAIEQARHGSGVLAVDAAPMRELVTTYERLIESTAAADVAARQAGLAALREVASLLDGRGPSGVAETEYVQARIDAVGRLAAVMQSRPPVDASLSVIEARNELDAISGTGSLAQIDAVLNGHADG